MKFGSILALDVGSKRIGVALANTVARLPEPVGAIANDQKCIEKIAEIIRSNEVGLVVIGLPRGLDGQDTGQTKYVYEFAQKLKAQFSTKIVFQDEALTSRFAEEELKQRSSSYNKTDIDSLAATYILNDYLQEKTTE